MHIIKQSFVDNKYLLLISTILFFSSLLLGYLLEPSLYSYFNPVVEQLSSDVKNKVIQLTFQDIFLNNIMIVFRMFIFGILLCFSAVLLVYNGFFLGYFIAGYGNLTKVLLLIIPHGIFELPSIIIATTSGLVLFKFLFNLIKYIYLNKEGKLFKRLYDGLDNNGVILYQSIILLAIASFFMVIAGIIEVYFTQNIANWLYHLLV